jgi:hypothetical protein
MEALVELVREDQQHTLIDFGLAYLVGNPVSSHIGV